MLFRWLRVMDAPSCVLLWVVVLGTASTAWAQGPEAWSGTFTGTLVPGQCPLGTLSNGQYSENGTINIAVPAPGLVALLTPGTVAPSFHLLGGSFADTEAVVKQAALICVLVGPTSTTASILPSSGVGSLSQAPLGVAIVINGDSVLIPDKLLINGADRSVPVSSVLLKPTAITPATVSGVFETAGPGSASGNFAKGTFTLTKQPCSVPPLKPVANDAQPYELNPDNPPPVSLQPVSSGGLIDSTLYQRFVQLRNLLKPILGTDIAISSGFRPVSYQNHLKDIRDTTAVTIEAILQGDGNCKAPRRAWISSTPGSGPGKRFLNTLRGESLKHSLKLDEHGIPIVAAKSLHSDVPGSTAIDVGPTDLLTSHRAEVDRALKKVGLVRPRPVDDPGHLQLGRKYRVTTRFKANSPINILVEDPLGRRVGFDPVTGSVINEIGADASYSGPNRNVQFVDIGGDDPSVYGVYKVTGVGTGAGPYTIASYTINEDSSRILASEAAVGVASPGQPIAPVMIPVTAGVIVTGTGPGGGAHVRARGGLASFLAYDPGFLGGAFVAVGGLDGGSGIQIITGTGTGGGAHVRAFEADGSPRATSFLVYPPGFTGVLRVASCDFDDDNRGEIVTGAGPGGGPHVRVIKLDSTGNPVADLANFFAYDPVFSGGVFVACGDVDGDGVPEILVGADAGGGPHVRILKIQADAPGGAAPLLEFFAYDPGFTGGIRVAAGNVDGSDRASIILGAGPGGGPHVRVLKFVGGILQELASFFAYDPAFRNGIFVAAGSVTGDSQAQIITGAGAGGGPHVRVFTGTGADTGIGFFAYDPGFTGGVTVAGSP